LSRVIKSVRLIDGIPRFLAVNPQEVYEDSNMPAAKYFMREKITLENKKLELQVEREQTLLETRQQAEQMVLKARQEAEEIITKVRRQEVEIREEFRQLGWEEGKIQGWQQAEKESANLLQEAEKTLQRAELERRNLLCKTEEEIVLLALDIAEKIIRKEVELGPNIIKAIAQQAIKKAAHRKKVIIRVNAADLEDIEKEREFLRERSGSPDVIILPDPTVGPGGCVLETDLGTVDARIETQLAQIRSALLNLVQEKEENDYESS